MPACGSRPCPYLGPRQAVRGRRWAGRGVGPLGARQRQRGQHLLAALPARRNGVAHPSMTTGHGEGADVHNSKPQHTAMTMQRGSSSAARRVFRNRRCRHASRCCPWRPAPAMVVHSLAAAPQAAAGARGRGGTPSHPHDKGLKVWHPRRQRRRRQRRAEAVGHAAIGSRSRPSSSHPGGRGRRCPAVACGTSQQNICVSHAEGHHSKSAHTRVTSNGPDGSNAPPSAHAHHSTAHPHGGRATHRSSTTPAPLHSPSPSLPIISVPAHQGLAPPACCNEAASGEPRVGPAAASPGAGALSATALSVGGSVRYVAVPTCRASLLWTCRYSTV